jgi:hypothetical protein
MSIITDTNISAAKSGETLVEKDLSQPEVPMVRMTRGGQDPVYGDYNYIDELESESVKAAKLEMWIAKKIGTALVSTYPSRQWGVRVDVRGGVMVILCPSVSNEKGYHLHLKGDTINTLEARSIRAAGEILERYGLSREKRVDEKDVEGSLKFDFKDEAIAPDEETNNPGGR